MLYPVSIVYRHIPFLSFHGIFSNSQLGFARNALSAYTYSDHKACRDFYVPFERWLLSRLYVLLLP